MSKRNETNASLKESLEIKRIQSEIAKNEEQRLKIQIEREQLQKIAALPWYKKKELYLSIGAAFIFVTLLWFYAEKLVIPMIRSDNIRLTVENERVRADLTRRQNEVDAKEQLFAAKNIEKLRELRAEYTIISAEEKELAARYKTLSISFAASRTAADGYRSQSESISKAVSLMENKIIELNARIASAEQEKNNARQPEKFSPSKADIARQIDAAIDQNRNEVLADLSTLAERAQRYYAKPVRLGGGGNSFLGLTADPSGLALLASTVFTDNANGTYTIKSAGKVTSIVLHGVGKKALRDGTFPSYDMTVTASTQTPSKLN